jgi:hypothetical protein
MFSRWTVTNITSASVTTFLAFLAGIISWSVYCTSATRLTIYQTRTAAGSLKKQRTTILETGCSGLKQLR